MPDYSDDSDEELGAYIYRTSRTAKLLREKAAAARNNELATNNTRSLIPMVTLILRLGIVATLTTLTWMVVTLRLRLRPAPTQELVVMLLLLPIQTVILQSMVQVFPRALVSSQKCLKK